MAAQPVLGVSEVRPPLLDDVPDSTGRGTRRASGATGVCGPAGACQTSHPLIPRRLSMNAMPDDEPEDDEVTDDEDFDEDSDVDEDDEDEDDESEEEEETWQVTPS
jgi:hypothetical protein